MNTRAGFSLVEIAIVLTIVGVVLVSTATIIRPMAYTAQVEDTREKMRNILLRLSEFVQRNNRLPCPSDPASLTHWGQERNSVGPPAPPEPGIGRCTDSNAINAEGIVPFLALGMREEDVTDAWGNFITYRVSPPWTINFNDRDGAVPHPNVADLASLNNVENTCRSDRWIKGGVNINPGKALFCCTLDMGNDANNNGGVFAPANADIVVTDAVNERMFDPDGSGQILNRVSRNLITGETPNSGFINAVDNFPTNRNNTSIGMAVILVSHGVNEHGAFIKPNATNTARRVDRASVAGNLELENVNGTNTTVTLPERLLFRAVPLNDRQDNTYFDDILMWRTNHQIYSENGVTSCAYPD